MEHERQSKDGSRSDVCYCGVAATDADVISCEMCKRFIHLDCLKSGRPSSLKADIFFKLICCHCSMDGGESIKRMKLQWLHVIWLTLYNLQMNGVGKLGYFRWKEHICTFIDRNWITFFGDLKKKTSLWYGTVAGVLSNGCPAVFKSGTPELLEPGWWRLTEFKAPTFDINTFSRYKKIKIDQKPDHFVKTEGLRSRRGMTSIQSAIELKARRSTLKEAKEMRRSLPSKQCTTGKMDCQSSDISDRQVHIAASGDSTTTENSDITSDSTYDVFYGSSSSEFCKDEAADDSKLSSCTSVGSLSLDTSVSAASVDSDHFLKIEIKQEIDEDDVKPEESLSRFLNSADSDCDLEIDPGAMSPPSLSHYITPTSPSVQEMLDSITSSPVSSMCYTQETEDFSGDTLSASQPHTTNIEESVVSSESSESEDGIDEVDRERVVRKRRRKKLEDIEETEKSCINLTQISRYEENELVERLNELEDRLTPELRRFRRKLIVRKAQRQHNVPVFDLDSKVNNALGVTQKDNWSSAQVTAESDLASNLYNIPVSHSRLTDQRILDRYQVNKVTANQSQLSFLMRLVGRQDHELLSVRSPYTTRILKPFIRRDAETCPLKLQLLHQIIAYPHRSDPDWRPPPRASIDYCYVRPEHIPSVNSLCRQFFWPGIDLSECLHYPDFTCVVLYRKIVIAFAFMVPDLAGARHNEVYISFIFTHPEWRGSGIATFMLYHLIQTCMGKDLTLHVAATNQAMMLYQKFGFKPEEYILGFYDKYYPNTRNQCVNAFFLRLRR